MKKTKTKTKTETKLWLVRNSYEGPDKGFFETGLGYHLLRSEKPPVLKKSGRIWSPIGRNKAQMCRRGLERLTNLKLLPGYYQEVEFVRVDSPGSHILKARKYSENQVYVGKLLEDDEDAYFQLHIKYSMRVWRCLSKTNIPPTGLFFRIRPKGGR